MPPPPHIEPKTLDLTTLVADKEGVREILLHRFEMEQLDAVTYVNGEKKEIVGYRDIRDDEFWVRGHFPNYPVFPGVLICEAAAQLGCYYLVTQKIMTSNFLGIAGLDNVRFRGQVRLGDRLVLVGKARRLKARQSIIDVQGFVDGNMVFHGDVIGVPLPNPEKE